jgi:hypothetical protein
MEKKVEYALCVTSKDLQGAIKRVSIGKGKSDNFTLNITTNQKEGRNRCTLLSGSNTFQAITRFYADLRILETKEDGTQELSGEIMKHSISVTMSGIFSDVVNTFAAIEDLIFLAVSENLVTATNTISQVPIPVKSNEISLINSDSNKFEITLKREELATVLKYNSLAVSSNTIYKNSYGLKPVYQNEKATLNIVSMVGTEVVSSTVDAIKVNNSEYPTICDGISFAMLDAAKIDQIIAVTETEKVAIVFYYKEGDSCKEVVQVNIKTTSSMYMMTTFVKSYPRGVNDMLKDGYELPLCGFTLDPKMLKSTLPILEIGCSTEMKKIEIHVFRDHIVICDQFALNKENVNSKEYGRTNIKDVITILPKDKEEEVFLMGLQQLMRSIKPYEKKLTIQYSKNPIVLSGTNEHVKHGISCCEDVKKDAKINEKDEKDIDESDMV